MTLSRLFRVEYQDWVILVSQSGSKWLFTCTPPNGEAIAPCEPYESCVSAQNEAKRFIDCMIAAGGLRSLLDDWLELGAIDILQHDAADRFISALIKGRIAHHSADDPLPPLQPQENPPDSKPEYPA